MCCILTSFAVFGPRLALFVWWLFSPALFSAAFKGWFLPIVMLLFAPFTMIMYLIVWSPTTGIYGWDWLWLGIGIALDVSSYAGGGYTNRHRLQKTQV